VVVNAVDGLRATDPDLIRMMRTLDGDRRAIFTRGEWAGALAQGFSGARIGATYAAVGAGFGGWSGSSSGRRVVVLQAQAGLNTARIFAVIVVLSLLALALYGLVGLAERLLVPWKREVTRA